MRTSRTLCILFAASLLAGCVTTQGTYIKEMDSKEPYVYSCDAPQSECTNQLKRVLVRQGFQIQNEDADAGVIAAAKSLADDEKVSTSVFTEAMTGVSTAGQAGRLSFIISEDADAGKLLIEMSGQITGRMNQDEGFTTNTSEHTGNAPQGHPMMVKYGLAIHETSSLTLQQPDASRLQRAQAEN